MKIVFEANTPEEVMRQVQKFAALNGGNAVLTAQPKSEVRVPVDTMSADKTLTATEAQEEPKAKRGRKAKEEAPAPVVEPVAPAPVETPAAAEPEVAFAGAPTSPLADDKVFLAEITKLVEAKLLGYDAIRGAMNAELKLAEGEKGKITQIAVDRREAFVAHLKSLANTASVLA